MFLRHAKPRLIGGNSQVIAEGDGRPRCCEGQSSSWCKVGAVASRVVTLARSLFGEGQGQASEEELELFFSRNALGYLGLEG